MINQTYTPRVWRSPTTAAVVAQHCNPANTPKLFRKLNSIGDRDVCYWTKADIRGLAINVPLSGVALVTGIWAFAGTGPDGEPVKLAAKSADVLRRQADGSWRFVTTLGERTELRRLSRVHVHTFAAGLRTPGSQR